MKEDEGNKNKKIDRRTNERKGGRIGRKKKKVKKKIK